MATAHVVRAQNDAASVESAINDFIANTTFTSIDDVELLAEGERQGYALVCILYTA